MSQPASQSTPLALPADFTAFEIYFEQWRTANTGFVAFLLDGLLKGQAVSIEGHEAGNESRETIVSELVVTGAGRIEMVCADGDPVIALVTSDEEPSCLTIDGPCGQVVLCHSGGRTLVIALLPSEADEPGETLPTAADLAVIASFQTGA